MMNLPISVVCYHANKKNSLLSWFMCFSLQITRNMRGMGNSFRYQCQKLSK